MLDIVQPTLLLDKVKCIENIERIISKARTSEVELRPHFKTHQSHEIGRWFRVRGVKGCTVSSLEMAEYFASDKWIDITVAFPLNILEIDRINRLASQIKLNLLISVPGVIPTLLKRLENHVGLFIEVDTGYHRTGVDPNEIRTIDLIIEEIQSSPLLKMVGFLSHAGQTYHCHNVEEVFTIHKSEVELLNRLKKRYEPKFPDLILSIGDTPTASVVENFKDVDEIRPGNLVFYDLTQHQIGSCKLDQIAIALACPVVATYPNRNEIVIYGGGVHFSKDYFTTVSGGRSYGSVVKMKRNSWELPPTEMYVKSISQEHGVIHAPDSAAAHIQPGDVLGILPVHSCLMADAMGEYTTTDGALIERFN